MKLENKRLTSDLLFRVLFHLLFWFYWIIIPTIYICLLFKATNYLEAANVVSSFFSNGGLSVEDFQHQEVM